MDEIVCLYQRVRTTDRAGGVMLNVRSLHARPTVDATHMEGIGRGIGKLNAFSFIYKLYLFNIV